MAKKWSQKYKRSIDCNNPKGFSQKAHCAGRKKRESIMNIKSLVKETIKQVVAERQINLFVEKNSPTQHAEINAIENACHKISNYRLINASIYCTLEPCHMCAMALLHSRVARVVFRRPSRDGALVTIDRLQEREGINHRFQVFRVREICNTPDLMEACC